MHAIVRQKYGAVTLLCHAGAFSRKMKEFPLHAVAAQVRVASHWLSVLHSCRLVCSYNVVSVVTNSTFTVGELGVS